MNKKLFLSALASTALLASCVENDLGSNENISGNGNGDGRISFVQKTGNMTRGTERAENANHYEFGVFTFLNAVEAASNATGASTSSNITMPNFLVGYASDATGKQWYKDRISTQTWGNAGSGDLTDAANNVSSWVYEQMGNGELTHTNATLAAQSLKYWDDSKDSHIFVAYTPYLGNANKTAPMGSFNIAPNSTNTIADVTFTGLSSFYTSPAVQTIGARTVGLKPNQATAADYNSLTSIAANNDELLNANEALYAYNKIDRANYGKDVPLTFQHVNAKVNLKFYHTIKGYNVQLIDMVPEDVATGYLAEGKTLHGTGASTIGTGKAITATKGVQLTPAIPSYVTALKQPAKGSSNIYEGTRYETASVTINELNSNGAVGTIPANGVIGTETDANLQFAITQTHNMATDRAAAISDIDAVTSTYYALPVYQGAAIKTAASNVGGTENVAQNTGYTVHVSYKLIPKDGTTTITVYDARVFVAPEYCKWEAGKAYTYIFKITDQSNGTTDPSKVDPDGTTTDEPYVDPDDPRIPDDPALKPIVFDGVLVTNYDETPTGKTDPTDEWVITDPSSWASIGSTAWRRSPALLNKTQLTETLGTAWVLNYDNLATSNPVTFNSSDNTFTVTDKESTPNTFKWSAAVAEQVTAPASTYKSSSISDGPDKVTAYSIYMWTDASAGEATKYTATPTAIDYQKKTVTTTYRKSTQTYVKTEVDGGSTTWTLNGTTWTPDGTESTLTTVNGWSIKTDTEYSVPTITYGTVSATPSAHPANAYAIVKARP